MCVAVPARLFYEKRRADKLPGRYVLLPMRFAKGTDSLGQETTHWIGMDWRVGRGRIVEHEILCDMKTHCPILWESAKVNRHRISGKEGLHPDILTVTRETEWMLAMRSEKRSRVCLRCEKAIQSRGEARRRLLRQILSTWKAHKKRSSCASSSIRGEISRRPPSTCTHQSMFGGIMMLQNMI